MERTARAFGVPFLVERLGNGGRVRIHLDDAVTRWSALVDLFNTCRVFLDQRTGGELAGFHSLLQLRDRDLVEFEPLHLRNGKVRLGYNLPSAAKGGIDRSCCAGG